MNENPLNNFEPNQAEIIRKMDEEIDRAFLVRATEKLNPEKTAIARDLANASERYYQERDLEPDQKIELPKFSPAPHEIVITDPNLYTELLRRSIRKINLSLPDDYPDVFVGITKKLLSVLDRLSRKQVSRIAAENVRHEIQHASLALENPNLTTKFGTHPILECKWIV